MMHRILCFSVLAIALSTVGCGDDNTPQNKTTAKAVPEVPPAVVEQPSPNPAPSPVPSAPVEPPAPSVPAITPAAKPKPPAIYKVRQVTAGPTVQGTVEDSRASKLATEILNLPLAERLEWTKQEFAKRGINDVHDDQ